MMMMMMKLLNATQNYWVFRLCPASDILKTKKHRVLEIGSVSVLRRRGKQRSYLPPPPLETETDPVSGTVCQLFLRDPTE
jgi:hypothetical protein